MLTVKAPIELKSRSDIIPSYEAFARRIEGNYRLLETSVTGEDLLHVVTEPPEIYLAEGSVSTAVNLTTINNRQENKLEILNQLLNRITVEPDLHMTYQDKVYITDVLHKLGIRNTQQFMKQVFLLKEETRSTTELVEHYWNHMEELQELVQNYRQTTEQKLEENRNVQEQNSLHLHREIMNRLQTGSIYQIISNFNHNQSASAEYIGREELKYFEYYRINRNILLNALENQARGENTPLTYRHENYYEEILPAPEEITEENITSQITAAVLLQLADNIYQNRNETISSRKDTWYSMTGAFYQSAENTMNRLYRNLVQENTYNRRTGDYLQQLNQNYRQELTLLEGLVGTEGTPEEPGRPPRIPGNTFVQNLQQYNAGENTEYYSEDNRYRAGDSYRTEQRLQSLEQNYRQQELLQEQQELHQITEGDTSVRQEQTDISVEQLEQFHRHNIENRNKYIQALENITRQETPEKRPGMQRMRQEGLLALENPGEMLEQLRAEDRERQQQAEQVRQQELSLLPGETRQIYEILEQYMQLPERQRQAAALTERSISSLQRDIETVERETSSERLSHTETENQLRELSLLPGETRQITRALREYVQQPEDRAGQEFLPEEGGSLPERVLERVEEESTSAELVHNRTERQLQALSETVVERWQENAAREQTNLRQTADSRWSKTTLVHRTQTETDLSEEISQQLLNQNRAIEKQTRVIEEVTQNAKTLERKVTTQTTREVSQETENITEIINRGVQGRIGDIADQVYSRLERRLQNERRRRGY